MTWMSCTQQTVNQDASYTIFYFGGAASVTRGHFSTVLSNSTSGLVLAFSSRGEECRTSAALCDGQWHHVTVVLLGMSASVSVFVDGTLVQTCTLSASKPAAEPVHLYWLGWQASVLYEWCLDGHVWSGSIANARIFDYALGAAAIATDAGLCATASVTSTSSPSPSSTPSQSISASQSGTASVSSSPLQCSIQLATSCSSNDLAPANAVFSAAACCSACGSVSGRFAWTWFGGGDLTCHLKASCGDAISVIGVVSGSVLASYTPTPSWTPDPIVEPTSLCKQQCHSVHDGKRLLDSGDEHFSERL